MLVFKQLFAFLKHAVPFRCNLTFKWLTKNREKHSSLFCSGINEEEKKGFLEIETRFGWFRHCRGD